MKVRDLIYIVAEFQAKKALADVQLISDEKIELTEEYVHTFLEKNVAGAAIEVRNDRISIISVNDEWYNCSLLLNEKVNCGWWVYFADNLNLEGRIQFFKWYASKELAECMCETITAMGLFDEIMLLGGNQ